MARALALTLTLAQGYVVVAADLQDSVYDDMGSFGSTLTHRSGDIRSLSVPLAQQSHPAAPGPSRVPPPPVTCWLALSPHPSGS